MHAIVAEKNVEEQTRHVLSEIFVGCSLDKVGVRLWDGTVWPDEGPRPAMLALKNSGGLGRMVYSCAYFTSQDEDLGVAQERKLDYLCRKLRLRPGQRLLDIGCGWGALAIHAAKHFGVRTKGLTLSEPQAEWARARIAEAGLTNEATIDLRDYREISSDGSQLYDAIVSGGMVEHVGRDKLPACSITAHRVLKPGG